MSLDMEKIVGELEFDVIDACTRETVEDGLL
jgi:hypothetical protein